MILAHMTIFTGENGFYKGPNDRDVVLAYRHTIRRLLYAQRAHDLQTLKEAM